MHRTRIKMCGFTRIEDINIASAMGVDAIGMVFYEPSPRHLTINQAQLLKRSVPPFITTVALFVNAPRHYVEQVLNEVQPDLLQFHGDESPEECLQYNKPYIKALRIGAPGLETSQQVQAVCNSYASAQAILFDSYSEAYGGSGRMFNWSIINDVNVHRVVLSGGLHAQNVEQGISQLQPFAVDVSSGIESAKGIKDAQKMQAFVSQVQIADQLLSD